MKHYTVFNVAWHTHLYRAGRSVFERGSISPFGHIVNAIKSIKGDPRYTKSVRREISPESLDGGDNLQEFTLALRTGGYKGVYLMGSRCMGWNEVFKQRTHHVADYLRKSGWLIVCAMNPTYPADYTPFVRKEFDGLFLVNFDNKDVWKVIVETLAVEARAPLYYHLVGTEPGTDLNDIRLLKGLGFTIVYDYIDEISREILPGIPDMCLARHESLLKDEDVVVVATADKLYLNVMRHRGRNAILSPNAVTLADWILGQSMEVPSEIADIVKSGRPIIGYYGNFATWMDYGCIRALAQQRPGYEIVMIGHDYDNGKGAFAASGISKLPNVRIVSAQKYSRLKFFSRHFSVGIIPFRDYELTRSVSPVKMFEYMAQGIPPVATGLVECRKYASCLNASSPDEFVEKVDDALKLRNDKAYMASLLDDAKANTWDSRGAEIERLLESASARSVGKLLSIVVPTYNMEKYLERCLESMIPPSWLNSIEIIIVNDGSSDGSLSIARRYEANYPGVVRVVDKPNGGHGSCINVGIQSATGRYFKIVDSDDWLNRLDLVLHLIHLEKCEADVVVTNYVRTFDGGASELVSYSDRIASERYCAESFIEAIMRDTSPLSYVHMHAITYKTSLLKDGGVVITEKAFYVDQEYITIPFSFVRSVDFQPIVLYRYYIGRPGQSVSPEVAKKRAPDNLRVLRRILGNIDKMSAGSVLRRYVSSIAFHQTWFLLTHSVDTASNDEILAWWARNDERLHKELVDYFRR